jgi:hypothetical protein
MEASRTCDLRHLHFPACTQHALGWVRAHFPASRCTEVTRCESGGGGQRAPFFGFPPGASPRHPHSDMRPCCALRQRYTMPCCPHAATPASARTVWGYENDVVIRTRLPHAWPHPRHPRHPRQPSRHRTYEDAGGQPPRPTPCTPHAMRCHCLAQRRNFRSSQGQSP